MGSESNNDARAKLAESGRDHVEALGEAFIAERFDIDAGLDDEVASSAHLERFTRTCFPRILLTPERIDEYPPVEQIKAVFVRLAEIVDEAPDHFRGLFGALNDPELFSETAKELKLTEDDFLPETKGGSTAPLAVVIAALSLTRTVEQPGDGTQAQATPKCYARHPTRSARFCLKKKGHSGKHRNPGWGVAPPITW